jgi:hypothetical protein
MQALAAPGTSGMRPTDAARGLLGDAIHREKVTIVSSRHPDFTQELVDRFAVYRMRPFGQWRAAVRAQTASRASAV